MEIVDGLVELHGLITKEGEAKLNLLISRACRLDILARYIDIYNIVQIIFATRTRAQLQISRSARIQKIPRWLTRLLS